MPEFEKEKQVAVRFFVRDARKVIIGVMGFSVLLLGVLCLVLPGPGTLIIPLGIALLATEFLWARYLLAQSRKFVKEALPKSQSSRVERVFAWVHRRSEAISKWVTKHLRRAISD